jgi:hypothetical protein
VKKFIITLGLLFLFIPVSHAYDPRLAGTSQYNQYSPNSVNYDRYNQYSPNNVNSPYNQYNQYSPDNLDNPYSQHELQYSPKSLDDPFAQKAHDFNAGLVSGVPNKTKHGKKAPVEDAAASFFGTKPAKAFPVFFYLLAFSSLAAGLTIFIIIGIFKK